MTGVGQMLAEARETRGVSLDQAERDTRIVRRYLIALEQEDFSVFPAEVYARGFLRSYASYLGLNPAEVVALMPREQPPEPGPPRGGRRGARPLDGVRPAPRRAGTSSRRPASRQGMAGPLMLVAVVLLASFAVGRLASGGVDPAAIPTGERTPAAATGAPSPTGVPGPGPAVAGRMPDLRGLDEHEALARLAELGVIPFVIEVPAPGVPAGQVLRQSPAPDEQVGTATVTIVIGRGG